MKTIFILLVTAISFSQSNVVTAGGDIENISYTIGNNLVELQIPVVKEVSLNIPTFEVPVESHKPKSNTKRKSLFEKIVDFIKNCLILNLNERCLYSILIT